MLQSLPLHWKEQKAFKLYRNLLSDEARQPWEKIVQVQTNKCPWVDVPKSLMTKLLSKLGTLFWIASHSTQQVFRQDIGEALKYYITNTLKRPNGIPTCQFLVWVEQLSSFLETLPCLYNSLSTNQATKQALRWWRPCDALATHLSGQVADAVQFDRENKCSEY